MYFFAWFVGLVSGAIFSGAILVAWLDANPRRLGLVVRWLVDAMAKHNGGLYIKMYVALFETRKASKVMAYVKPEDLAEAIGWYALKPAVLPIPLQKHPGMANADSESEENPRTGP